MSVNDLAGSQVLGTYEPELLYAGEAPIVTDAAPTKVEDVLKYEVLVLDTDGLRRPDLADEENPDTGDKCVIAAQPAENIGDMVPYFAAGKFNHEALVWPEELDTYAKRRNFFQGTDIHIGHIA